MNGRKIGVVLFLCGALCFSGCTANTSKLADQTNANYESVWSYDQDHHFKKSLDSKDDSVIDYNTHYLDDEHEDSDGYLYADCIICGYRRYSAPIEGTFAFGEIEQVYYPYSDGAKTYLLGQSTSPDEYLVSEYCDGVMEAEAPIVISWTSEAGVDHFDVVCSCNSDFSESDSEPNQYYTVNKNERSVAIYNLYTDRAYYVKVTQVFMDSTQEPKELVTTIQVGDISTRVIHVDGIKNVRDLGGYATSLATGSKTKQGMIYRGSALKDETRQLAITKDGEDTFLNSLGIKTEIELRDTGVYVSPLSAKLNYTQLPIAVYNEVFDEKQTATRKSYVELMDILADEDNYPVYIHCQQGDDRTGTVAFFLNALLGVSYNDLCIDYEMTSFSPSGLRGARNGQNYSNHFTDIYSGLLTYGETDEDGQVDENTPISVCAENFFKSLGVTEDTIEAIRRINIEGYQS